MTALVAGGALALTRSLVAGVTQTLSSPTWTTGGFTGNVVACLPGEDCTIAPGNANMQARADAFCTNAPKARGFVRGSTTFGVLPGTDRTYQRASLESTGTRADTSFGRRRRSGGENFVDTLTGTSGTTASPPAFGLSWFGRIKCEGGPTKVETIVGFRGTQALRPRPRRGRMQVVRTQMRCSIGFSAVFEPGTRAATGRDFSGRGNLVVQIVTRVCRNAACNLRRLSRGRLVLAALPRRFRFLQAIPDNLASDMPDIWDGNGRFRVIRSSFTRCRRGRQGRLEVQKHPLLDFVTLKVCGIKFLYSDSPNRRSGRLVFQGVTSRYSAA